MLHIFCYVCVLVYIQSKPSIVHSSVVHKPSLVHKSWVTNCFYVVKALNSGKPSLVNIFFSKVAWNFQRYGLASSWFLLVFFHIFLSFSQSYHNRTHLEATLEEPFCQEIKPIFSWIVPHWWEATFLQTLWQDFVQKSHVEKPLCQEIKHFFPE